MNLEFREDVRKATYYPSERSHDFDEKLRRVLGFQAKYESARLSLGRSLAAVGTPEPLPNESRFRVALKGEILFGDDVDLWISLFLVDSNSLPPISLEHFRRTVEAHWARGMDLLESDWEASEQNVLRFIQRLASLLPEGSDVAATSSLSRRTVSAEAVPIELKVGTVSLNARTKQPALFHINGPGVSPHIALMGKVGSGKTQTAMAIAHDLLAASGIPMLLIDPKGDFPQSRNQKLFERAGIKPKVIEVGREAIPMDFLPPIESGAVNLKAAAMQLRDSILLCCKSPGNLQADLLRDAIETVLIQGDGRSLEDIRDAYVETLAQKSNKPHDSIVSRLNEIVGLPCFEPQLSAAEFFEQSWVLDLKSLPGDEIKRLVILLVLDALRAHLLVKPDSRTSPEGFRALRHLLVIDEARRILAEKNYQSLADVLRQGRSKGSVVMLISQDPSDFDGQADDFTTQLGTVVSFTCAQTTKGLRALQGAYGRKLQPAEFSDTHLPTGVAFCKLPGHEPERIICWESSSLAQ